ncbi:MAG TPA: hypothetical protein VIU39_09215 [Anaerolineales bacterium]
METVIGGLFKREDQADAASRALRREGFGEREVSLLARKPHNAPVHLDRIQAPAVGRSAVVGAVMLAMAGALLGLLLGIGVIPLPGVDAATYRVVPAFVLSAVAAGAVAGGVTGAILGVASRLFTSRDKVAITSQGVKRGGLLLVVRPHDDRQLETARRILEQNGAVDLQDLNEKWDPEVWSDFNQVPLADPGRKDSPG